MKKRVLIVPGFVVDVYSEIEASFVELSAAGNNDIEFVWVVPEISNPHNLFSRQENRGCLREPMYVEHLRRHGIPCIVANISKYNPLQNWRVFRQIFRRWSIDTVYTQFGYERFWAAFFGKLWGKRVVWNEHWCSLGTRYVWPKRIFYRWFIDEFISISRFITSTLPPTAAVHTVLNAIQPSARVDLSDAERTTLRARLGLKAQAPVVLMVAGFRPEKRHALALDICEQVQRARPDTQFVFLGSGTLREPIMAQAAARGLSVIAPGFVDNVDDYYRATDVCMLTSHYEPFGYCVLEGMKFGLPVVCFNNGGPAEVIRDGETGVLIPEGDAEQFAREILRLLADASARRQLGEHAQHAIATEYSRRVWIARIKQVLVGGRQEPAVTAEYTTSG